MKLDELRAYFADGNRIRPTLELKRVESEPLTESEQLAPGPLIFKVKIALASAHAHGMSIDEMREALAKLAKPGTIIVPDGASVEYVDSSGSGMRGAKAKHITFDEDHWFAPFDSVARKVSEDEMTRIGIATGMPRADIISTIKKLSALWSEPFACTIRKTLGLVMEGVKLTVDAIAEAAKGLGEALGKAFGDFDDVVKSLLHICDEADWLAERNKWTTPCVGFKNASKDIKWRLRRYCKRGIRHRRRNKEPL